MNLWRWHACLILTAVASAACQPTATPAPPAAVDAHERKATIELTAAGMKNAEISVVPLQPSTFSPHLQVAATIGGDPRKMAQVGARLQGRVVAVRVQLGDKVRRGDPLVEVDGVEVHQVALDYLNAVARRRAAEDVLARQRQLVDERVGAVGDLRKAESDAAIARAAVGEATEHLKFLGLNASDVQSLARTARAGSHPAVVRAPIDGRVAALDVSLGRVLTGEEPIVTLTQLDRVAAILRVYERDVAQVRVGTYVEVEVPAYPGRRFAGKVAFVGDLLDSSTRTLQARVDLDNADGALKPGMTAVASVPISNGKGGLWIPADAIQPYEGSKIVFVAVGERRFQPRVVTAGDARGGYVPLLTGVERGTSVVVKGALSLRGELERAALEEE